MNNKLKEFFTFSLGVLIVDFIYNFIIKEREIFEPPLYQWVDFILFYIVGVLIAYGIAYLFRKLRS